MITPTDEQVEAALLPCPFCGEPGKMVRPMGRWLSKADGYGPDWYRVSCSGEHCNGIGLACPDKPSAIAAWNRRALTAAFSLAAAGTVEVKPLQWEEINPTSFRATAIGLRYYAYVNPYQPGETPWSGYSEGYQPVEFGYFATAEEVQAACEADYEARIRSALLPPQPSSRGQQIMSLQSDIDWLVDQHDRHDFYQNDVVANGGVTAGMVLLKSMRDALERLSVRMCPACEGNGFVRNPHARYSEEYADGRRTGQYSTNDPEEISCPTCGGVGFRPPEGIEKIPELYEVSEEPF